MYLWNKSNFIQLAKQTRPSLVFEISDLGSLLLA